MDELRIGIQSVINNLQKIEMPATHDNCLYMYASLEQLASIRDKLLELIQQNNDGAEANQNGTDK